MFPSIRVLEWSAFAQDMTEQESWRRWAKQADRSTIAPLEHAPALECMPPILRRRASPPARLAAHVAYGVNAAGSAPGQNIPMVLASRYGDAQRSLSLLADLVQNTPVSPTGFGLSVHNAIGALYAMAAGHTANMVVITAGARTVAAAFTEVMALLAEGAPEVVLVSYDAPLPAPYTAFQGHDLPAHAWAIRVAAAPPEAPDAIAVQWAPAQVPAALSPPSPPPSALRGPSLDALHQLLGCLDGSPHPHRIVV